MSEAPGIHKAILPARDRFQARLLVGCVTPVLAGFAGLALDRAFQPEATPHAQAVAWAAIALSAAFSGIVWMLRSATPAAAAAGGVICLLLTACPGESSGSIPQRLLHSGLAPLLALFVLTFVATRAGRARKTAAGLAESRGGRDGAQVIANLGMAGLVAGWFTGMPHGLLRTANHEYAPVLLLAALCEATADTLASEIGQAFGGTPFLLTTLRRVPAGTDGAISLPGTAAALAGLLGVAAAGRWSLGLSLQATALAAGAGVFGLFVDSLVGATVERRGWLGNNLVNFLSTVATAGFAGLLLVLGLR